MPQAQYVGDTFAERGHACQGFRILAGAPDAGREYIGRVPMRVPIGVRPATGEPVPWSDLTVLEQADPANAAGARLWSELSNAQKKNALEKAARAERERSIAPPPEDVGVTGATGSATF